MSRWLIIAPAPAAVASIDAPAQLADISFDLKAFVADKPVA